MVNVGSVVARRQLGRQLRRLREESGRTRDDVATGSTGIASRAKLARIEQGLCSIRPGDVRELCLLYGAAAELTERLVELARATMHEEWWESRDARAPRWFGMYLSLEEVAEGIQAYEPALVHGLFQTPDYTRLLVRATEVEPGATTDTVVTARQLRQRQTLDRQPPLRIELVLAEAALRVGCDDPRLMPAQVARLRELAARPEIDVRIVPLRAGLNPGAYGRFTILDFPDPMDPPVVYLETYDAARYPERAEQVARFRRRFQSLHAAAVPLEEFTP